jgi:hypothetical protein
MVKVKEMPHSEKFAKVLNQIMEDDINANLTLLRKHVDEQVAAELKNLWQDRVKPVPENASI